MRPDSQLALITPSTATEECAAKEGCDISVVIPAYNRAFLLRRTLASVLAQTIRPLEIIIVDDGSSEEEARKIQSIAREFEPSMNVRLLVNEKNRGLSYARNRGISEARGKYVAFLDSDDLWMPAKLESQWRSIESARRQTSKPIFSATGTYRVDGEGTILRWKFCKPKFDAATILKSSFMAPSSVVVETSMAREINGFAEDLRYAEDWEFFIRLVDKVQFVSLPDPLTIYVVHQAERLSRSNPKSLRALLLIRRRHMRDTKAARENPHFYRKFARELQVNGKDRAARKFYIRSLALAYPSGLRRRLIEGWLTLYYHLKAIPSLREKQRFYRLGVSAGKLLDPTFRRRRDHDQQVIRALMS